MMKKITITTLITVVVLLVSFSGPEHAGALLTTSSKYKKLYNEKVALEIELKALKRTYRNEKNQLNSRIRELESQKADLQKELDNLNDQTEYDNKLCEDRIKELQKQTDILKKEGTEREKELLEQNKKMQERYEKELNDLKKQLQDEQENHIQELKKLREEYDKKISELNRQISAFTDEISELKKLNKKQKEELERMQSQADELEKQLKEEIQKGEIRLKRFHNKLIINIDDKISFDSGSADLKKGVFPALEKISRILADYPENQIIVEGHTDNVPIRTSRFRNNWQLSTERALSVLEYLLRHKKLDPTRFSVAGYGEYQPIVSNDSPSNRALNRRVDIVVIPRLEQK